jgi:DNA-binding CsgD family transcriptional regulator/tetratricopeptide (TPR) repeat protein
VQPMIGADMSARVSSPIFIGRLHELATLNDALGRAESGDPAIVLVGGEAGIGKSRLVDELAIRARDRGAIVIAGGSISLGSDEGLPFASIAEALRGLVRSVDREMLVEMLDPATRELGRLVPELDVGKDEGPKADSPPEWAQTRLFEGFLTLLARLGRRHTVVLIVEDLHWADRSTRDLVAFVTRHIRDERVLILGTYRSDELHRRHPLRPWLAEMERLSRVDRVELVRFNLEELSAQVAAILDRTATPGRVDLIARRSEGNPFFAEELLASGPASEDPILPSRLKDVLLGRLGSVSQTTRGLLAAASVAGGSVDHEVLGGVLGIDEGTLTMAIDEAVSTHLLRPASDAPMSSYAFRHALLGEALYDDLLASERRRLHAAFAAVLDARAVPDGAAGASHLAALAHHATAAHDLPLALRASIAAARASSRASAYYEAALSYERAVELWDAVPASERPPDADLVELLYEGSEALSTAQEPDRAKEMARMAVEQHGAAGDPRRRARLDERLGWAVYLAGDLGAGTRVLEEAAGRLAGRPASTEGASILAGLATFVMYAGKYRQAIPIAERAIAASRATGARGREVESMGALGSALAVLGDCGRGLSVLREGLALARQLGEPFPIGSAFLALASTLHDCDALEESVTVGLEGADWARDMRFPGFATMATEALIPLGRWQQAQEIFDRLPQRGERGSGALWNGVFQGILAVRSGRLGDAQALHDVRRGGGALMTDAAFAGNLAGALLELALAEGRLTDARLVTEEALAWLDRAEDVRFRSRVLQFAVRVESEIAAIARARRDGVGVAETETLGLARLDLLRGLMAPLSDETSPVFGEARGNLALAEAEATRLVDRPDPSAWAAAAELFATPRRPYELAWCRYRQAESILKLGRSRAEASSALAEAWSIADGLGAAPLRDSIAVLARITRVALSPATTGDEQILPDAIGHEREPTYQADPFGLTSREREVLGLLVLGHTNKRIADALFISESTASVHVSNILGKLGVGNRAEAAVAAVRLGLTD